MFKTRPNSVGVSKYQVLGTLLMLAWTSTQAPNLSCQCPENLPRPFHSEEVQLCWPTSNSVTAQLSFIFHIIMVFSLILQLPSSFPKEWTEMSHPSMNKVLSCNNGKKRKIKQKKVPNHHDATETMKIFPQLHLSLDICHFFFSETKLLNHLAIFAIQLREEKGFTCNDMNIGFQDEDKVRQG